MRKGRREKERKEGAGSREGTLGGGVGGREEGGDTLLLYL